METPTENPTDGTGESGGNHVPPVSGPAQSPGTDAASSVLAYGGNPSGENPAAGTPQNLCPCGCGTVLAPGKTYVNETHRKRVVRAKGKAPRKPAAEGLPSSLDALQTPGGDLGGLPGTDAPAAVPWLAKDVEPLVAKLVELVEEAAKGQILTEAKPLGLPPDAMQRVAKDAAWNEKSKELIAQGASELSVLGLNKSGIPPEYRPGLMIGIGVLQIGASHMATIQAIRAEVALHKKQQQNQQT